jgi:hypothetical protein
MYRGDMSENTLETNEKKKINVKEAAKIAADYLEAFYLDAKNIQLEEVELSDDRLWWFITLSFIVPDDLRMPMYPIPKSYKIFKIDAITGEVISMKIRELSH